MAEKPEETGQNEGQNAKSPWDYVAWAKKNAGEEVKIPEDEEPHGDG